MPLEVIIVLVFLVFAGAMVMGLIPIYRFMQKQDRENEKWTKENLARMKAKFEEEKRRKAAEAAQDPPAGDIELKANPDKP